MAEDTNIIQKQKKALIFGVAGQDGSYLSEFLLENNYIVHGVIRRSSNETHPNLVNCKTHQNFHLHYGDMSDAINICSLVSSIKPDEIYNLAAQSHVKVSFLVPEYTADIDALGVLRILEAVRIAGIVDSCRIYQASTSELFGNSKECPQNELTRMEPYSPYAVAKLYAHKIVEEYRNAYGMFCCCGILFNHESERRGESFVTRKITKAVARIKAGKQDVLYLGNLDSKRDWGYAKDYVKYMWKMLQMDKPDDYVIATGKQYTVRDFCTKAFNAAGINIKWSGDGINEHAVDASNGKTIVRIDKELWRPTDVVNLLGDPQKAISKLGWNPHETTLDELINIMLWHDMAEESK
jgi:GDPmannose 4,6-dehydratase